MIAEPIDKLLRRGERIVWMDTPRLAPFVCGSLPVAVAGLVWLTIPSTIVFIIKSDRAAAGEPWARGLVWILAIFFFIGVGMLLAPLYRVFEYKTTNYCVTSQRIITRGGVVARETVLFELRHLASATITIGVFDRMFGTGTIGFVAGTVDVTIRGVRSAYGSLRAVKDPYGVFKVIQDCAGECKECK